MGGLSLLLCIHITSIYIHSTISIFELSEHRVRCTPKKTNPVTYQRIIIVPRWNDQVYPVFRYIELITSVVLYPQWYECIPLKSSKLNPNSVKRSYGWYTYILYLFTYINHQFPIIYCWWLNHHIFDMWLLNHHFFPGKSPRPWQSRHPKHRIAPWINWAFKGGIGWGVPFTAQTSVFWDHSSLSSMNCFKRSQIFLGFNPVAGGISSNLSR